MGIPSSLPTNPNPSPSPPLPQSPPPQTPPLPQSPPPQSPPPPPSQIPPLIPPTPLSPQSEPQNETGVTETPIPDSHSAEPAPEPVPTQTKTQSKTKKAASKPKKTPVGKRKRVPSVPFDLNSPPQPSSEPVSKRTRSSSQTPAPVTQSPITQSPLHSPAPASSADTIEEGTRYKDLTLEFLSSLRLSFKPTVPEHKDMIYFRCAGIDRELDMAAMNAIFGFRDSDIKTWSGKETVYDLFNSGRILHLLEVIIGRGLQKPLG
ncbi:vegetative cell wall protein gp1-like [Hevea brasiliensis]|uniref:vegetative cell wall protein gp1-like n=1 Tax=Hevea brasiliensis TaxID=3981 RepID=UPI0025F46FD4|nr:vegetative cell wall protein gp1-like [Hevea brasiliensis]